ncbi:MAG: PaaI family thioesterase [Sneathiella sp.]|nr:PaaI family thioesterase [Sneathiella sp.]
MTLKSETAFEIPDGFTEAVGRGEFATRNGPFYEKEEGGQIIRAFRPDNRHLNGLGYVHGGMLMSFADSALARTVFHGSRKRGVTLKMNSEFLMPARPGEWVEAHCELVRETRSLAFVRGELKVKNRAIFKADAIFHFLREKEG